MRGQTYTDKQGQYLAFIHAYTVINGRAPAHADLQAFFGVTPPTVHRMLQTLAERGLVVRTPGVARSLALNVQPEELPVLKPVQSIKTHVAKY